MAAFKGGLPARNAGLAGRCGATARTAVLKTGCVVIAMMGIRPDNAIVSRPTGYGRSRFVLVRQSVNFSFSRFNDGGVMARSMAVSRKLR